MRHDTAAPGFFGLGLSEPVLRAVSDLGYDEPTPVQREAIPHVLAGRDLLAAAQTGTGKTAAFLLPALSALPRVRRGGRARDDADRPQHGPSMLVVTPTRELAQQIGDVCRAIEARTHHESAIVVGGVGYEPQRAALRRGCDVLVATPGRLVDLLSDGSCDLSEVRVLVLDEADRMLDMGFLPTVRRIVAATPDSRQTLLFSATLDEGAVGSVRDLVRDPAVVEVARRGTAAETIDQYALPVSLEAKNALLAQVIKAEGPERAIVFCRTKHRADACCRRLRRAGVSCAPIHGNRSQGQRERALAAFRGGSCDVLVATDVLARGIDVADVRYVVNFDVPADPEDYIHRIGRTGRAGETGWALTFVTENDADDLLAIERLMGREVPAFPRAAGLELGTEPPDLDAARAARGAATGESGPRRARRASAGERDGEAGRGGRRRRRRSRGGSPTAATAGAAPETAATSGRGTRGDGAEARPGRKEGPETGRKAKAKARPEAARKARGAGRRDGAAAGRAGKDKAAAGAAGAAGAGRVRRRPGDRLGARGRGGRG